jgi:hypothetical protein
VTVGLRLRPGQFCSSCCQIGGGIQLVGEQSSALALLPPRRLLQGLPGIHGGASQLGLDLRNRRQATFEIFRENLDQVRLPCGYPHRLVDAAQRVLDERLILGLAQQ